MQQEHRGLALTTQEADVVDGGFLDMGFTRSRVDLPNSGEGF